MFWRTLQKCWDGLVRPTVRLPANFPLTLSKLGHAYFMGTALFLLGSMIGPAILLLILLAVILWPEVALTIGPLIIDERGQANTSFMVVLMLISFVGGFGLEIAYLSRRMVSEGMSFRKALALNSDSLKGSSPLATFWAILWRPVVAWGLWLAASTVLEQILPPGQQDTVDFAKNLGGGNLFVFGFLAAVLAPIFEEIVFRGFLFNALRTGFRDAKSWKIGQGWSDFLAIVLSSAFFALMHLQFNPTTLLMLFLMGCLCAELYRRSGSLYCSIVLHALNNGMVVLMLALSVGT